MRRRRGGFGRRRRSAPVEWVAQQNWSTELLLAANAPQSVILAGAAAVSLQYDPPVINRFRVERVQGSVSITSQMTYADAAFIAVGIIVCQNVPGTGYTVPNVLLNTTAGMPWLYYRSWVLTGASGQHNTIFPPFGDFIDTLGRTRRVVRENQGLLCSFAYKIQHGAPTDIRVHPALRTLISRVA